MQITKKSQLAYRTKRKKPKVYIKESGLQLQCNDYLAIKRIKYFRIPDWLWKWLAKSMPEEILIQLRSMWGGLSDNTASIPISDKYSLTLHLELKSTKGKLHGKQKVMAKELPIQISRTPEESMKIIDSFIDEASWLKALLETKGIEKCQNCSERTNCVRYLKTVME